MVSKYKTHEIAKDLGTASKEIIKILKDNLNFEAKHMTVLGNDELNFILDYYTKENEIENFDNYFSARKVNSVSEENINFILESYKQKKDISNAKSKITVEEKNESNTSGATVLVQESEILEKEEINKKIINTKDENVNIDKYNKKYDVMADDRNIVKRQFDPLVSKQKLHQKIHQYKKINKKKESENERLARIAKERKLKPMKIFIPESITISELALKLKVKVSEVLKKTMEMGMAFSINDLLDFDTASLISFEFHAKVVKEVQKTIEEMIINNEIDKQEDLVPRPPIVVVMGHVDHGKTSLLDRIRRSNVVAKEKGGITQHIGAYKIDFKSHKITFLDTPGHEAFTALRARGTSVTDIAVLVIAADDGVKPQTIEAIHHAKEANVSIVIAINKMDKPNVNIERIKQQLNEHGIAPEEWGGDTPFVEVSAKTGKGINELLEMIVLISDIRDLRANPFREASGTVIESRIDKGSGPIATLLITNGTLKKSDIIIVGSTLGKVRTIKSDLGIFVNSACPSDPVEVTGLDSAPASGDKFSVVKDEKLARQLVNQREYIKNNQRLNSDNRTNMENLFDNINNKEKEFKIILKTDVQGSLEAIKQSIDNIKKTDEDFVVKIKIIHDAIGAIKESDVMLAVASNAVIIGFNVRPSERARQLAENSKIQIKLYQVIYDCINDLNDSLQGLISPKFKDIEIGIAECRKVYKFTGIGVIAGCYVISGKIERNSKVQVLRDDISVFIDKVESLKRFKDDAKKVITGHECGIKLFRFSDIKIGDKIRAFETEKIK